MHAPSPGSDWLRVLQVFAAGGALVGVALVIVPWGVVIAGLLGLFVGGMWVDREHDDRESRKRVAHRVGLLVGLTIGALWGVLVELQGTAAQRAGVILALSIGAGLAALAATLVGMDARGGRR